jgi:hypothetical protein
MRKQIALGAALFLGATGSALAADEMSYNLMEFGYGYTDIKNSSVNGDTFSLGGSFALGESLFGVGSVSTTDAGGFTAKTLSLGLGFHAPVSSNVDFVGDLSFALADPEGGSSDTGFGVGVGLRGRASDKLELNGGVRYVDFGHGADGVGFTVGSRYYFTEAFAAGIDLSMDDSGDAKTFGIGFRYDFGY